VFRSNSVFFVPDKKMSQPGGTMNFLIHDANGKLSSKEIQGLHSYTFAYTYVK
jgi:hypothetical protein